jgi:hypothetical protein
MTLNITPSVFNSKVIDVSGVSMKFDIDDYGKVTAISVLDNDVDVWIVTGSVAGHFVNVCNIQWLSLTGTLGFDLGWRTSPTDSLQIKSLVDLPITSGTMTTVGYESITYLPTTTGTIVTVGVDYNTAYDGVYEYTEHVDDVPSEVLTSNRNNNRIYAYYLYPERVSARVSKSIARRVHFLVSGTSTYAVVDEVDLTGWLVGWLCKEDDDDDILYAANASYVWTIDFEAGTFSTDAITIAPYVWSEQAGRYVYFVYRSTTLRETDYTIDLSYERLDILTKSVTSVSLGSVAMPGRPGHYTIINQTYKARLEGGILLLEWYIADGLEMGVLYATNGVSKSVQWTKVGSDTIDYSYILGNRPRSGFVGNCGNKTHLLGFQYAWSTTRYYSGYAHLDDIGITVLLVDTDYPDLLLPGLGLTKDFIPCSSKYVNIGSYPYFIDSQGIYLVVRDGGSGNIFTYLDPADYDCSELYPSWAYLGGSGIEGVWSTQGGNTRDDIDDSIYIYGKLISDGSVRLFGIDEYGNLIKKLDIISELWRSHTYDYSSYSSTSQSMIVNTRYTKDKNGHWSYYRGITYYHPFNPDYVR